MTSLVFAAACAACGRSSEGERVDAASSSQPPAPATGWRVDGVPFEPKSLLAIGTQGESSWRVTVARAETDCAALRAAYPDHSRGVGDLDIWFALPLGEDGKPTEWSYRSAHEVQAAGSRSLVARGAMVNAVIEEDTSVLAKGLELALQGRGAGGALYQFEGELRARQCGRIERPEPRRPQRDLKLTISGRTVEINGATLHDESGRKYLKLTRAPHRCDSALTEGYDFHLDLALDADPAKVVLVALLGDAFPESATGSRGRDTFVVKAPELRSDKREVRIELAGTLDAGGFPVTFEGAVDALRCIAGPSPNAPKASSPAL